MADHRTKLQKLEAMARQTASPQEAEVAKRKLAEMGHPQAEPRVLTGPVTWRFSHAATTRAYDDILWRMYTETYDDLFSQVFGDRAKTYTTGYNWWDDDVHHPPGSTQTEYCSTCGHSEYAHIKRLAKEGYLCTLCDDIPWRTDCVWPGHG